MYVGDVTVATRPGDGASSYTRYPDSADEPAEDGAQDKTAPAELTEPATTEPGDVGGVAAEAVDDVLPDVMNCAVLEAADATPWLSTAVT